MKNLKSLFWMMLTICFGVLLTQCKKDEKSPGTSTTELLSKSVSTGPTMDGAIDASWANCQTLTGKATVPDLPDFVNYVGESYNFTMRSMYDASNIYFLIEYDDPKDSKDRQSWYFDGAAKKWKQQNKFATSATDKFYEDKIAFLWPVASDATWEAATCYATCHAVNQSLGYTTTTKHYASSGQTIDMWHWKRVRTEPFNMVDDQKIVSIGDLNNPTDTEKKEGGRGSDDKTAGGYADNKQTLNNGSAEVSVPKYVIPNATDYYWITKEQIDNGTAKLITGVDANGVLTYDGGTIDPSTGGYEAVTGAKRFPSITINGPFVGSRGDIQSFAVHQSNGWVLEVKRALKTSDAVYDIQYDINKTYMFGFAIFENAAIAHGIKPNLMLKFELCLNG